MRLPPLRLALPARQGQVDAQVTLSTIARLVGSGVADNRADLVRATGLARSTVVTHTQLLIDAGVVVDLGSSVDGRRGRPVRRLALTEGVGLVVVIDVGMHGA